MSPKAHAPTMVSDSTASNPYTGERCGDNGRRCARLANGTRHATVTASFTDDERRRIQAQIDVIIARSRGEVVSLDERIRFHWEKDRDAATGRQGGLVAWGEP